MSIVVRLVGFLPPPRDDNVPWTRVHVEEAAAPTGPWTLIDDQALAAPIDPDPSAPRLRNITTANATLDVGWYRVTFFDAAGSRSEPSDPLRNSTLEQPLPPSPSAIRNMSPLLRKGYPLPPTNDYQLTDLRNFVYQSTALVQALTWRIIDTTLGCAAAEDYTCELVPDALVPIALDAITKMSERLFVISEPAFARQIATGRRLRGFSAGPYSEQYFAPGEFARRGAVTGRPVMDNDDAIDAALWALATEDARDYFVWRATGVAPPIGVVTGFDYRRQSIGYGAGASAGGVGGLGHGGPDGF